eukprot:scaffold1053_cov332-Pavlova_lutheri.AAC.17
MPTLRIPFSNLRGDSARGVGRSESGSPGLFFPTKPGISPGLTRLTGQLSGVLGDHVHEYKPNRCVIGTPLVGIGQAIGSLYPLNTFIPPNAKVVFESYCKGDVREWTVGHICDVSLESRHLGMTTHFLSKRARGRHKNLRNLCAYLLGRLEKSSKAKDILELQVA